MARTEDVTNPTPESSTSLGDIKTLDITQDQMFKILLDKLTIIDSDAQDQRKEIFSSLLNQIALLTQKLKQLQTGKKQVDETVGITEDVITKVGERKSETETRTN